MNIPRRFLAALLALFFLSSMTKNAGAAEASPLLQKWLEGQSAIHRWSADFKQTRTLKSLAQPLVAEGRVWFVEPNQFRWELGNPAETIALREKSQMMVVYPKLKRAEKYPLTGTETGPWKDALVLLEAGFPRSERELEAQFRILSEEDQGDRHSVRLEPKSGGARRMMPEIRIEFSREGLALLATELKFADGSTLRNDFTHPQLNPELPANLFQAPVGPDFKIIEPARKKTP